MARIAWQLRYRSPISPTKGVDDVIIETDTDSEPDAKVLAEWWLATHVPSPATRFVYVRRLVVATTAMMQKALAKAAEPPTDDPADAGGTNMAQAASRDSSIAPAPTGDGSDEDRRPRGRSATPLGRVGA